MNTNIDQNYKTEHEDRLLAMGEMAASLAHEIRNPLGSMELYCSILKRELKGDKSKLELLDSIQHGISTLSHIVSNCLLFTKDITVSKKQFTKADLFLLRTSEYVSSSFTKYGITLSNVEDNDSGFLIEWEESGSEPFMMDPYIIGQIALNLCTNSIDALLDSNLNKDERRIKLCLDHSNKSFWLLSVEDNGKGMSKSVLDKMYDPFFTTKEKGTGLGLAIVHSLVKAHGGELKVSSELGEGTKIEIKFKN